MAKGSRAKKVERTIPQCRACGKVKTYPPPFGWQHHYEGTWDRNRKVVPTSYFTCSFWCRIELGLDP